MARAIWNGTISFGLVTIPVGLHPAIESRERLSFDLLHAKDHSRIQYRRFCQDEGVEVPGGPEPPYAPPSSRPVALVELHCHRDEATSGSCSVGTDAAPRERGEGSASPSATAAGP